MKRRTSIRIFDSFLSLERNIGLICIFSFEKNSILSFDLISFEFSRFIWKFYEWFQLNFWFNSKEIVKNSSTVNSWEFSTILSGMAAIGCTCREWRRRRRTEKEKGAKRAKNGRQKRSTRCSRKRERRTRRATRSPTGSTGEVLVLKILSIWLCFTKFWDSKWYLKD